MTSSPRETDTDRQTDRAFEWPVLSWYTICSSVKDSECSASTVIRTDRHDLIDKRILLFLLFKLAPTDDGVEPLTEFVPEVLVLGQFSAVL